MKVNKKELPKSEIEFTVEIPWEEMQNHVEVASRRISKDVKIDGYRPGKVPFDVLKQHVGEATIMEEAANIAVRAVMPEILEAEKKDVIAAPKIEVTKIAINNPLIFKAVVPLLPDVKLGDYKSLKTKRKPVEVTDQDANKVMEDLQKMRAKEKLVDREAKKGDKIEFNLDIFMDKVPVEGGQSKKTQLVLGSGEFIPGLEDQVLGMKKDEEKEFSLDFPKEYHQKNLAGRPGEFKVKVLSVFERELPELNDEFAKSLGKFNTLEELKKNLAENMKREKEEKEKQRFELEIIEEVAKKSEFADFSNTVVETETDKMLSELEADVAQRGMKFDDYLKQLKKTKEELKKELAPQAERRIKTALISRRVAEAEKITIDDKTIDAEIQKSLEMYQDNEEIKNQLNTPAYKSYLRNMLTNRKVFEFLTEQAGK